MEQKPMPSSQSVPETGPIRRPQEQSTLNIDDFVRIYDPNSDQILVEKRS